MFGAFGVHLHGRSKFFHAGGSFFQTGRLLFCAMRQIIVARSNFFGCGVDIDGGILDFSYQSPKIFHGAIHAGNHCAKGAWIVLVDSLGQITFGQCARNKGYVIQAAQSIKREINVLFQFAEVAASFGLNAPADVALSNAAHDLTNIAQHGLHSLHGLHGVIHRKPVFTFDIHINFFVKVALSDGVHKLGDGACGDRQRFCNSIKLFQGRRKPAMQPFRVTLSGKIAISYIGHGIIHIHLRSFHLIHQIIQRPGKLLKRPLFPADMGKSYIYRSLCPFLTYAK